MKCSRRGVVLARVIAATLLGLLVFVPPTNGAGPTFLPLAVGNRWELKSPARSAAMVFEVINRTDDEFLVRWDNPWVPPVVYGFRPAANLVFLRSLDLGTGVARLPEQTVYFDFDAAESKRWSNLVGEFQLLESATRVQTPSGVYDHCIHVRLRTKEKSDTEYFLAPGVGFVQLGSGPAAYKLVSFRQGQNPKTFKK